MWRFPLVESGNRHKRVSAVASTAAGLTERTMSELWDARTLPLDPDAPELSEIKMTLISVEFPKITKSIYFRRLQMFFR